MYYFLEGANHSGKLDLAEFLDEFNQFAIWDKLECASENQNVRYIKKGQTIEALTEGNSFMSGSFYFGEWIMTQDTHKWVPDGRGIIINWAKNLIYMGRIRNMRLDGYGRRIPFEKKYNCIKGHKMV